MKSVRTDHVYRNKVKTFFKVRSTVTIDCFKNIIIQCRCYAPFNTFPIYYSTNSVSPNGLYGQEQLSLNIKLCLSVVSVRKNISQRTQRNTELD